MFGFVIIAVVVLAVAALVLLPGAIREMRKSARQAGVLGFYSAGRPVKGRHVKRSARHAYAGRILAAHRA